MALPNSYLPLAVGLPTIGFHAGIVRIVRYYLRFPDSSTGRDSDLEVSPSTQN